MEEFSLPVLVKLLLEWSNTKEGYPYHTVRNKIEHLPASQQLYERFYKGDLQYPSYGLEVFGIDSYLLPEGAAFSIQSKVDPKDNFLAKLIPVQNSTRNPPEYIWDTSILKG